MDGDLSSMLQSVLSDPAQMEKIAKLAQGLMGDGASSDEERTQPPDAAPVKPPGDSALFSMLGKAFGGKQEKSRAAALLLAMRPYMRPEKQEKLDRAMKIAQIVNIAGAVMKQYGGDFFGL